MIVNTVKYNLWWINVVPRGKTYLELSICLEATQIISIKLENKINSVKYLMSALVCTSNLKAPNM